ncbi:hypothetical protein K438DRAFT_1968203 [Mycena galopus ATCC 62051]|nr:hypothetical protein K438DRAFT_1968203 [Mycena galopus ATCC 62051]
MSQSSDYSNLHQCRWNWCRKTYPTVLDLAAHVKEHVRETKPCRLRDIAELRRIEDGIGESLSGITLGLGTQSEAQSLSTENPSLFLPSQGVPSPIPHLPSPAISLSSQEISYPVRDPPLPAIDFSLLPETPSRPMKRRKIMSPNNNHPQTPSRLNSTQTFPPSGRSRSRTPGFASLALPDSAQAGFLPNPDFPDLDTLISNSLSRAPAPHNSLVTPNGNAASQQSFSGSDASVERQLTQDFDTSFDDALPNFAADANGLSESQNLYAGELNWDEGPAPNLPRSRSPTSSPSSQSQSQQQHSSPSLADASPRLSRALPSPARQSWYQSPRRVSNGKKTSPTLGLAGSPSSQPTPTRTPVKTYLSGTLKISTPESFDQGAINPRALHQPLYPEFASQSPAPFIVQTQAPYRSQSASQ